MDFTAITELRTYVHPQLNNCPVALIDQEAMRCVRQFCEQTQVWEHELPPIRIKADKRDYPLSLDDISCAEIERVKFVRVVKDPTNSPDGRVLCVDTDWELIDDNRLTVRFSSTPTETTSKGLRVTVGLRPTRTAREWECSLFEKYYEYIANGTLARLKKMQRRPWTDMAGGVMADREYWGGITLCRSELARGFRNATIRNTMQEAFFV